MSTVICLMIVVLVFFIALNKPLAHLSWKKCKTCCGLFDAKSRLYIYIYIYIFVNE